MAPRMKISPKDFTIEKAEKMVVNILENSDKVRKSLFCASGEVGKSALMATKLLKDIYDNRTL